MTAKAGNPKEPWVYARNFSLNKIELSDEGELVEVIGGPNWWYSRRQQSELLRRKQSDPSYPCRALITIVQGL